MLQRMDWKVPVKLMYTKDKGSKKSDSEAIPDILKCCHRFLHPPLCMFLSEVEKTFTGVCIQRSTAVCSLKPSQRCVSNAVQQQQLFPLVLCRFQ